MSIPTLKAQQNIVAVVVDDSRSMSTQEDGSTRIQKAVQILNNGLVKNLQDKFQVRIYRLGDHLERVQNNPPLNTPAPATRPSTEQQHPHPESPPPPSGAPILLTDRS